VKCGPWWLDEHLFRRSRESPSSVPEKRTLHTGSNTTPHLFRIILVTDAGGAEGLTQRLLPVEDPVYSQGVLSEPSSTYLLRHAFGREPNERIEWSLPCCLAREARERH
jgi:hypothetical protein